MKKKVIDKGTNRTQNEKNSLSRDKLARYIKKLCIKNEKEKRCEGTNRKGYGVKKKYPPMKGIIE